MNAIRRWWINRIIVKRLREYRENEMKNVTWEDDFELWNKGRLSGSEIERRLLAHGLSDSDIDSLIPDLLLIKQLEKQTAADYAWNHR